MTHCHNIEAAVRPLKHSTRLTPSFGGTTVLIDEAFRQVLQVMRASNWQRIVHAYFYSLVPPLGTQKDSDYTKRAFKSLTKESKCFHGCATVFSLSTLACRRKTRDIETGSHTSSIVCKLKPKYSWIDPVCVLITQNSYSNESWFAECAILKIQNKRFDLLNTEITSLVPGLLTFFIALSMLKTQIKPNFGTQPRFLNTFLKRLPFPTINSIHSKDMFHVAT